MTSCPRVEAVDSLADVRATLEESGAQVAAVFDERQFVGMVGLNDLREVTSSVPTRRMTTRSDALDL